MDMDVVKARGLVLLGCGKMGSAMLAGWLKGGLPGASVWVIDPMASDWVLAQGVHVNEPLPASPAIVLVAVKPQMMGDALPKLAPLAQDGLLTLSNRRLQVTPDGIRFLRNIAACFDSYWQPAQKRHCLAV